MGVVLPLTHLPAHPLLTAGADLRTQMSVYPEGGGYMHTPNLERLANRTVLFERAYVQVGWGVVVLGCSTVAVLLVAGGRNSTTIS